MNIYWKFKFQVYNTLDNSIFLSAMQLKWMSEPSKHNTEQEHLCVFMLEKDFHNNMFPILDYPGTIVWQLWRRC